MALLQYFLLCFAVAGGSATSAVALWSHLGCGLLFIEIAQSRGDVAAFCVGFIVVMLLILYVFDFFAPPHLPGQCLRFCKGTDVAGMCLLFSIGAAGFLACVFSARLVPSLPLLATTFLSPVGVILIHQALISEETVENMSLEQLAAMKHEERISLLQLLTEQESKQCDFCTAAMGALALTGFGCICAWVPWAMRNEPLQGVARDESELLFVLWVAPLVVGLSNLVFALFVSLRVALNSRYRATHSFKNRLVMANILHSSREDIERHRDLLARAWSCVDKKMSIALSPVQVHKYLTQHVSCLWLLSTIMKAIGCALAVMIGAAFATFQLVTAIGPTASLMVQSFTCAFLLTFVSFVVVCFGRLWQAMSEGLAEFPLWRSVVSMTRTVGARAAFVLLVLPVSPLLLALSALNQAARRWRGLKGDVEQEEENAELERPVSASRSGDGEEVAKSPCNVSESSSGSRSTKELVGDASSTSRRCSTRFLFTHRVRRTIEDVRAWDWVPIVWWWYIVAWILIVVKLTPLLLNILLAWMSSVLGGLPFGVILAATFALGMVLFMLPPVPGPPIYLFGGVVISGACPYGFWWGTVICIGLSFALKLTACAVQQKLIGERLGSNLQVRRSAGVHTPLVRAIEMVLRKPGLSFNKCMILCGGPDWPTSVLAGILRLPLSQCLVGTIPVILSVIPLCLTGSFYLRRSEGQLWVRAGNLMFSLTALVSVGFWAGMGWAAQDVYDKYLEDLQETREEFLELEWLDYRAEYIAGKLRLDWNNMPLSVRAPFLAGAICLTVICHVVLWRSSLFFGSFNVTGDVGAVMWFGETGLFRPCGPAALALMLISSGGFVVHWSWDRHRRRSLMPTAVQGIDILEELWKEQKMEQARELAHIREWEKAFAGEVGNCLEVDTKLYRRASADLHQSANADVLGGNAAPLESCTAGLGVGPSGGADLAEPDSPLARCRTSWSLLQATIFGRPLSLSLSLTLGAAEKDPELTAT